MDPKTMEEALAVLVSFNAPPRLLSHGRIVAEVAKEIGEYISKLGAEIDIILVVVGATLHDIGKTTHTSELNASGSLHEAAGEALLVAYGYSLSLASVCVTHGQWRTAHRLEDVIIAVADQIWRGVRNHDLELHLTKLLTSELTLETWDVYSKLDSCLTSIAANADKRLADAR